MIRASGLYGRALVDLDTAERIGSVDEIIVDPHGPGIAGFVVSCDGSLVGTRKRMIVPMDTVHAIGPDALTVRTVGYPDDQSAMLDGLPRLSELTGRRMVSFGGRLLGEMADALVDEQDGRIIGYPLERTGVGSWIEAIFGLGWRSEQPDYVRADAPLRIGARLIVVPDEAIAAASDIDESPQFERPERTAIAAPPVEFGPTPSEIREAQSTTRPFSMDDILASDEANELAHHATAEHVGHPATDHDRGMTDEGLGLDAGLHDVDPDDDTALISPASTLRGKPRRRLQAERMR